MENEVVYSATPMAGAIYPAMGNVMKAVEAIGKNERNEQQGFNFRGIDNALNSMHSMFAENNIILRWEVLASHLSERTTNKGNITFYNEIEIEYCFVSTVDGSFIKTRTIGGAADTGDKHFSKALAMALKYVLFHTFLIPTHDPDPDGETQEPTVSTKVATSNFGGATDKQISYLTRLFDNHRARLKPAQIEEMKKVIATKDKTRVDSAIKFLKEFDEPSPN